MTVAFAKTASLVSLVFHVKIWVWLKEWHQQKGQNLIWDYNVTIMKEGVPGHEKGGQNCISLTCEDIRVDFLHANKREGRIEDMVNHFNKFKEQNII